MASGPDTLVSLRGVRKTFRRRPAWLARAVFRMPPHHVVALDAVDLDLPRSRTLGLVGESGSGKTTLGRVLAGLEPADAGTVTFDGREVRRLRGAAALAFRRRCQVVFQNPYASLNPRHSVRTLLAVALRLRGVNSRSEQARQAAEMLGRVGLGRTSLDAYPREFSGGQRQRLALARALAAGAEFLVLDEPTSALDVSIQAQILALLSDLQQESGLTYLLISHNIAVVESVADRIAVMKDGRIVECGQAEAVVRRPEHPYTASLLAAVPRL